MSAGLVGSLIERIQLQRDLVQAMDEHCRSISARVTSRDGSVSVQVDGLGAMTGLWLAPSAYRHGATALARLIVETAQASAKVAAERQQYLLRQFSARMLDLQRARR